MTTTMAVLLFLDALAFGFVWVAYWTVRTKR